MANSLELSWLFQLRQLAMMIDSGIPIDTALASLESRLDKSSVKFQRAIRLVKRGVNLPDAFRRSNLVGEFDYGMLLAADQAGSLSDGLNHISERRINQMQRVDSFKASLVFPKVIIIIAAFAGIFVRTASGNQSMVEACVSVGMVVGWFYLIIYATLFIVRADTRIWMSWFWPYPFVRNSNHWYRLALEYYFFNSLVWQISAGVAASSAAKGCSKLLRSQHFQRSVLSASEAMAKGVSLTQALKDEDLLLTERMRQVLLIADQSGTHEAAIKHELRLQRSSLKLKAINFFKWAPRLFYLIALVLASKLIGV